MTYVKTSIPRASDNAGSPVPKDPNIIIIDADSIDVEPTREKGNTVLTGTFTLKTGEKAFGLYATPTTISLTEEISGDADGKGITKGIQFQHPGNSDLIKNFLEAYLNKPVVILVKDCDGSAEGRMQIIGSKCNPLTLSWEPTLNNEATRRQLTFKQAMADGFMVGSYSGTLPELAAEPGADSGSEGA